MAAPARQQRARAPGQLRRRAAGRGSGLPARARILADACMRGTSRAGGSASRHRQSRGRPRPGAGAERAGRSFPVRQGQPDRRGAGGGPGASGAGPGVGPGAQRRDERTGSDQAPAARYGGRYPALHQRGSCRAGRAYLQPQHRRRDPPHRVADHLRVHADRPDHDLGARGYPRGPLPLRGRARRARAGYRAGVRLAGVPAAARGAAAGPADVARATGRARPRSRRGGRRDRVRHRSVHARVRCRPDTPSSRGDHRSRPPHRLRRPPLRRPPAITRSSSRQSSRPSRQRTARTDGTARTAAVLRTP